MLHEIAQQVQALTLPIRHETWVPDPVTGLHLHVAHAPALLDQLREATEGAGSGGYGRGGSEKRTRSLIDGENMKFYADIRHDVHEMLIEMEGMDYTSAPVGEVKDELKRWHRLYASRAHHKYLPIAQPKRMRRVFQVLQGWTIRIESTFNPQRKIELTIPCPNSWPVGDGTDLETCGQRYVTDAIGDRSSALVAVVDEEGSVKVYCRACGGSWAGEMEISILGAMHTLNEQKAV